MSIVLDFSLTPTFACNSLYLGYSLCYMECHMQYASDLDKRRTLPRLHVVHPQLNFNLMRTNYMFNSGGSHSRIILIRYSLYSQDDYIREEKSMCQTEPLSEIEIFGRERKSFWVLKSTQNCEYKLSFLSWYMARGRVKGAKEKKTSVIWSHKALSSLFSVLKWCIKAKNWKWFFPSTSCCQVQTV